MFIIAVRALFCLANNGIAVEYPGYLPAVSDVMEPQDKPVQQDAQFEYELYLVAENLQRAELKKEPQYYLAENEEKEVSRSAGLNFIASHNKDGSLKNIAVADEKGNPVAHYEIEQGANGSSLTLSSPDSSLIALFLDKDKMTARITKVRAAQGITYQQLTARLGPVITFMGYRLEV